MSGEASKAGAYKPSDRIGKYEVLQFLARGGMGEVYKALDTVLRRTVALKVLSADLSNNDLMLKRFQREAQAAAKLRHENIVTVYDVGETNGVHYLALEFVTGHDLQVHISRKTRLDPKEAIDLCIQAARALHHAHLEGVVHRDIKPSNFMITPREGSYVVKLSDFGLARQVDNEDEFRITRAGTTVGTVDYMSPEQARDCASADIRSDIYSLGCTLFHMLAGDPPYRKGGLTERLLAHLEAKIPDVRDFNPAIPDQLAAVLVKMMAKKPHHRYQTPRELLTALEELERKKLPAPKTKASSAQAKVSAPESAVAAARKTDPATRKVNAKPTDPQPKSGKIKSTRFRDRADTLDAVEVIEEDEGVLAGLPMQWMAAGAALLVLLFVGFFLMRGSSTTPDEGQKVVEQPPPPTPRPVLVAEPKKPSPESMVFPELWDFEPNVVGTLKSKADPQGQAKEFLGPFAQSAPAPTPMRRIRLNRAAPDTETSAPTFARALARAQPNEPTLLEIADNGPWFVPALPELQGRDIVLRPAEGFKPILAWDVAASAPGSTFWPIDAGRLVLENLDFVVKWQDASADRPARFFEVKAGSLEARHCTFSAAGRHPKSLVLAAVGRGKGTPLACSFTRCYVRGADLTLFQLDDTSREVLFDQSLFAGRNAPAVKVTSSAERPVLRLRNATLAVGRNLVEARGTSASSPAKFDVWALDSILARGQLGTEGDLLLLADSPDTQEIRWNALGAVYAGFKNLLGGGGAQTLSATDLPGWQALWPPRDGEVSVLEPWPLTLPSLVHEMAPVSFATSASSVSFAARCSSARVGCDTFFLPPEPINWGLRTYDRRPLMTYASLDIEPPMPLEPAPDGLYRGERFELSKVADLGAAIQKRLAYPRLASRVVFHVVGKGKVEMSPLRIQGVQVAIVVEPGKEVPVFEPTFRMTGEREAFLDVEGGSLTLVNCRFRVDNNASAPCPAYFLKARDADVSLLHCQFLGPMTRLPGSFHSLLSFAGPTTASAKSSNLLLRSTVLLSGKHALVVPEGALAVRAVNSIVGSLDDAFVREGGKARSSLQLLLDHNTFALKKALLDLRRHDGAESVAVQTHANVFADPFGDAPQSLLVRCTDGQLSGGALQWQGKRNAFDARLHAYLASTPEAGRQKLDDWLQIWGSPGESDAERLEQLEGKVVLAAEAPVIERLALPRADAAPVPGVDFAKLAMINMIKKK